MGGRKKKKKKKKKKSLQDGKLADQLVARGVVFVANGSAQRDLGVVAHHLLGDRNHVVADENAAHQLGAQAEPRQLVAELGETEVADEHGAVRHHLAKRLQLEKLAARAQRAGQKADLVLAERHKLELRVQRLLHAHLQDVGIERDVDGLAGRRRVDGLAHVREARLEVLAKMRRGSLAAVDKHHLARGHVVQNLLHRAAVRAPLKVDVANLAVDREVDRLDDAL